MSVGRMPVGDSHVVKARLIKASGKQCQGCGYQFPKQINEHQLAHEAGALELDHKIPLQRGGTDEESNLWALCLPCHDGKTNANGSSGPIRNMTEKEWRAAGAPQNWDRKNALMRRPKG